MAEHTLGPWEAKGTGVFAEDKLIAVAMYQDVDLEAYPNAQLMGAAPELLEALELYISRDISDTNIGFCAACIDTEPCEYHSRHQKARAAIAKARGTDDA